MRDPQGGIPERVLSRPRHFLFCLAVLFIALLTRIGTLGFDADINRTFLSDSLLSQARSRFETQYTTRLAGRVIEGNSITLETFDQAFTPAAARFHALNGHPFAKPREADRQAAAARQTG